MKRGAMFDFKKNNIESLIFELEEARQREVMDVLLEKANEPNFGKSYRIDLIFASLKRLNISIFDMMIKNERKLWTGKEKQSVEKYEYAKIIDTKGTVRWVKLNDDVRIYNNENDSCYLMI